MAVAPERRASGSSIRARFIEEAAKHMDHSRGIAAAIEQPDHLFATLIEISVIAKREGQPQPFPWFIEFCSRLRADELAMIEPPPEPVAH